MPDTREAIERYGPTVYRTAYAYVRSKHDADDIFQEVFLRYSVVSKELAKRLGGILSTTVAMEG